MGKAEKLEKVEQDIAKIEAIYANCEDYNLSEKDMKTLFCILLDYFSCSDDMYAIQYQDWRNDVDLNSIDIYIAHFGSINWRNTEAEKQTAISFIARKN